MNESLTRPLVLPPPLAAIAARSPVTGQLVRCAWILPQRWKRDRCNLMAAAMAFYGLISVFPTMLAAVAIMGDTLLDNQEMLERFQHFARRFFPGETRHILDQINQIAHSTNGTTLSVVALICLLWSSRAFFNTLALVLNSVWPNARPRTFWQHEISLSGIVLGAGVLWFCSTSAVFLLSVVRALAEDAPDFFINRQPLLWSFLTRLTSFTLTTLMFWMIYRFLPNVQGSRSRRVVLAAAVLASAGWELAKFFFAHFIRKIGHYEATYGSVAGVVITLLWIFVSSCILLFGAEAAGAWEEARRCGDDHP